MGTENWNRVHVPDRVSARARDAVEEDANGCLISTYSRTPQGYAQIGWGDGDGRHMVLAHRAAWEGEHGAVPAGMTLDHTCRVHPCVNVAHLRLLSNFENGRRNGGEDFPLGQCAHGHGDKHLRTYKRSGGRKSLGCSKCRSDMQRRYREKAAA